MSLQDKRLLRQLRKHLGTQDFHGDWDLFIEWLKTQQNAPEQSELVQNLPEFLESVEIAYQENENKLAISERSLVVSSGELYQANQKILESKRLVEELLDSLDEGFLVLNEEGFCTTIVSRKAKDFLETDPTGKHFLEILKVPEIERSGLSDWWDYLFTGKHDFKQLKDLAPEFYPHSDAEVTIKLDFKPIYENGRLRSVILISKNISEQIKAKKEAQHNLKRLQMVQCRYQNAESFVHALELVPETVQYLQDFAKEPSPQKNWGDLRRSLHTLKGAMLMVSIEPIAQLTHKIESEFDEHQSLGTLTQEFLLKASQRLDSAHQEFLETESEALHLKEIQCDKRSVPLGQLKEFFNFLTQSNSPQFHLIAEKFQRDFLFMSLDEAFYPLRDQGLKLATQQGKLLDIVIESKSDDRLDPNFINPLVQNLVHIINNSIDHGIEAPMDREDLGKAARAKIKIQAEIRASELIVHIEDDGQGIDTVAVKAKALRKGLISEDADDNTILQQIFADGFSTKESVTLVSGRGVGLSAVQSWLHLHEGTIQVSSEPGLGSRFTIRLKITNHPQVLPKVS